MLCVIRKGRFAKMVAAFHQITGTVQPRAENVFQLAVDLLALSVHHNVALEQAGLTALHFVETVRRCACNAHRPYGRVLRFSLAR